MEYTQQQVRLAIGAGEQALRYWKRFLPPLIEKNGKAALFSVGEMLALLVVKQLVQAYKTDVSAIGPIAEELFSICSRPLLFNRHPTLLWIDLQRQQIALVRNSSDLPTDRLYLVIPISQLWQEISTTLIDVDRPGEQRELIPLASVG